MVDVIAQEEEIDVNRRRNRTPAVTDDDSVVDGAVGAVNNTANQVTNTANQVANTAQNVAQPDNSPLKLRLDLNLDVDIELRARVHGDVTLSLLR